MFRSEKVDISASERYHVKFWRQKRLHHNWLDVRREQWRTLSGYLISALEGSEELVQVWSRKITILLTHVKLEIMAGYLDGDVRALNPLYSYFLYLSMLQKLKNITG